MILPSECLENLKCSICNQILSLFPIYVTKNEENQLLSICGRCQVSGDNKYLRNEIYETLAKMILFPCINREFGCMEDLLPEDVKEHESQCCYQLEKCVFSQKNTCKWEGRFNQLLDHYKTEHNHLILDNNNKFVIEMNKNHNTQNILQYQDEMFIFEYSFDKKSKHFKCSIIPLSLNKTTKQYYGQISLKCETYTLIYDFNGNGSKSFDINIANILQSNITTILTATIQIVDTKKQLNLNYNTENVLDVLLECCGCNNVLCPPIFQCTGGHYACNNCKGKCCTKCLPKHCECRIGSNKSRLLINKCISCYDKVKHCFDNELPTSISNAMNFINYRCQYDGCKFFGNPSDIQQHHNHCLYKPYSCLLKNNIDCKWEKHRKDIAEHIFEEHKENTIRINEIISLSIDMKSNELKQYYRFLRYSGNLFKIVFQYKNPYLLWRVEIVNSIEESCNYYKFEVIVFDKNDTKLLTFKESCSNFTFIKEYDRNRDIPCVWLHVDQINNCVHDNVLSFKINLLK